MEKLREIPSKLIPDDCSCLYSYYPEDIKQALREEYSADVGEQKHKYAGTNKGQQLKIGNNYESVDEIERLIMKEKMPPYAASETMQFPARQFTTI